MDWQFKIGIGLAVFFGILPFAVKDMPHWVTWPGLTIGALFVLWGVTPEHDKSPHAPIFLFIACAAGIAGSIAWFLDARETEGDMLREVNVSVECISEILPKTFAPNETVRALQLFPLPVQNGGGGLPILFNRSGKDWQWPAIDSTIPIEGYRCEVTNYGTAPLFDFVMLLDLTFFEAVDVPNQPNAKAHGAIKLKRDWRIDVPKIDIGATNAFVFYIFNNETDQFVHVLMPKTATARKLGNKEMVTIDLTVPNVGSVVPLPFGPRFTVNKKQ